MKDVVKQTIKGGQKMLSCFVYIAGSVMERGIHLQVKDNRARTGEGFVTAGDTLHPDGEGAVSSSTGILKWKIIHITTRKMSKNHFYKV